MALCATRHGATDMGLRCGARARGQDEFQQARQAGVVVGQRVVQLQQGIVFQQLIAGHGQLAAQVEQLVLNVDEQIAHILRQGFAQQQADMRVQLIHIAHGVRTAAVLRNTGVVPQAGGSIIASAGGDLRESVAHKSSLFSYAVRCLDCALHLAGKCSLRQPTARVLALQRIARWNAGSTLSQEIRYEKSEAQAMASPAGYTV